MDRIIRWFPACILMGIIFYASAIPSSEMPDMGVMDFLIKKGGHFFGYGLLAFLVWFASGFREPQLLLALMITVLYACTDEFHQSFVNGRNASIVDVFVFDSLGGLVALVVTRWWRRKREL